MNDSFQRQYINYSKGRLYFIVFSLSIGLGSAVGTSEIGAFCDEYKEPCSYHLKCINSSCQCIEYLTELVYTADGAPVCQYLVGGGTASLFNPGCSPGCATNQVCYKYRCRCVEGYVKSQLDNLCRKVVDVKPMQTCEVKESAMLCDPSLFSTCRSSKCICFKKYYYNFTTEECLLKPSGYKALYNEYCRGSDDCLEGLHCNSYSSYQCECPTSCPYNDQFGACDCGEVSFETPVQVIVVGCILGIFSVIFWIYAINKIFKRAGIESNSCDIGEGDPLNSMNTFPIDQPISQDAKPNLLADEPPTYKEAVFSTPSAPVGFNTNNTSIIDGNIATKNCATPYVPFFPLPQRNQDMQSISASSVDNLPYPIAAAATTAPGNLQQSTSAYCPTAPHLITDNSNDFSQVPYPVSPLNRTNDLLISTTPYPLSPLQVTSDNPYKL